MLIRKPGNKLLKCPQVVHSGHRHIVSTVVHVLDPSLTQADKDRLTSLNQRGFEVHHGPPTSATGAKQIRISDPTGVCGQPTVSTSLPLAWPAFRTRCAVAASDRG